MKISSMIWMCTLPILMALTQSASADSFCETRLSKGSKPTLLIHDVDSIKTLPDCVFEIEDLAVLEIKKARKLTSISKDISKLTKLEKLVLESTSVESLPSSLSGLKNLKSLTLSENKIGKFPDVILKMDSLEQLRFLKNQDNDFNIAKIPTEAANLPNLKHLAGLSGNFKTYLSFTKLQTLEIVGEAEYIEDSLDPLTDLKEIILRNGNLISSSWLPPSMRGPILPKPVNDALERLEKLQLISCFLSEFPEEILDLSNLKYLSLNGNSLKEFPEFGEGAKNMEHLDLGNNEFKTLSDSILTLSSLTFLDLSGNKFTEIPEQVFELNNVEVLQLGGNPYDLPIVISASEYETLDSLKEFGFVNEDMNCTGESNKYTLNNHEVTFCVTGVVKTKEPIVKPTMKPVDPSEEPTADPSSDDSTADPTEDPTSDPSDDETKDPSDDETKDPNDDETKDPSDDETKDPSDDETKDPSDEKTKDPSDDETKDPSGSKTKEPTANPTEEPTKPTTEDPDSGSNYYTLSVMSALVSFIFQLAFL